MKITIEKIKREYPYDLLLIADETVEGINKYVHDSEVYVAENEGERAGVFCLIYHKDDTAEIMNIAVLPRIQRRGVGSCLLKEIEKIARMKEQKAVIVGTADCGVDQIRFYEKNGYCRYALKKNYFLEIYEEPIYENGVQLKDMVMLKKELPKVK